MHWPYWNDALKWLLEETGQTFALVGVGYTVDGDPHPRLRDLLNCAPSMEHIFALAEHAKGVVTTSNALAHYCAMQRIPCLIGGNEPLEMAGAGNVFRQWLRGGVNGTPPFEHVEIIPFHVLLDCFQDSWKSLFES
jgi:hypothetical protein